MACSDWPEEEQLTAQTRPLYWIIYDNQSVIGHETIIGIMFAVTTDTPLLTIGSWTA